MPQLDVSTFPSQLFWLAITFIVLYWLMARAGLPRIVTIIDQRSARIAADIAKAGEMKTEAEAVIAAYERALAEARAGAQATLRETTERLNAEAAQRLHQASAKLAGESAAAERRITEAKAQAIANLRDVAVEVAQAAAMRLVGSGIDAARTRAAVDTVLRERA